MPAAVHAGSRSRHVRITQQMENIMMLMMSERGKKERHRRARGRARGTADSPKGESRAALSSSVISHRCQTKSQLNVFTLLTLLMGAPGSREGCAFTPLATDLPQPTQENVAQLLG